MSDNYLYVVGLEHQITELEQLLREASKVLDKAFFVNYKYDNASKKLRKKIDEFLDEENNK